MSSISDVLALVDPPLYFDNLYNPCKFYKFWITYNKWLSIGHMQQFKIDKFSKTNTVIELF